MQSPNVRLVTEGALDDDNSPAVASLNNRIATQALGRADSRIEWPANLVAFWDFTEDAAPFVAKAGVYPFELVNGSGSTVGKSGTGPFGTAADFDGYSDFLAIDSADVGALNVGRLGDEVTVLAWVRRTSALTADFIAGMWQEDDADARRQYGLFLDLATYGGDDSVCGHVSLTGEPSPNIPFSRDYSATGRRIALNEWRFVAFTYDGAHAVSYLDGVADYHPDYAEVGAPNGEGLVLDKNPYAFDLGLNKGAVADFTVGAVSLTAGMSNHMTGQIGGVAVFSRALTAAEVMRVHLATTAAGSTLVDLGPHLPAGSADNSKRRPGLQGWHAARGASATDTDLLTNGYDNFAFIKLSGNEYMYRSASSGSTPLNITEAAIGYFDTIAGVRVSHLDSITFQMNASHAAEAVRLAIKIDGAWYATNATYSMGADGATGSNWATAETKTVAVDRAAANWRDLTLTPGSSLSLAGSARSTDIPNGEVQGVGIYSPTVADGHNVRIKGPVMVMK